MWLLRGTPFSWRPTKWNFWQASQGIWVLFPFVAIWFANMASGCFSPCSFEDIGSGNASSWICRYVHVWEWHVSWTPTLKQLQYWVTQLSSWELKSSNHGAGMQILLQCTGSCCGKFWDQLQLVTVMLTISLLFAVFLWVAGFVGDSCGQLEGLDSFPGGQFWFCAPTSPGASLHTLLLLPYSLLVKVFVKAIF